MIKRISRNGTGIVLLILCFIINCNRRQQYRSSPFIIVLGIVQDGGFPHAGCEKACCAEAWKNADLRKHVSCLGIVDPASSQCWIIDATPDFPYQLHTLTTSLGSENPLLLKGILLTHAHMGHYTGLMYLGREAMGSQAVPVYAMKRMRRFLRVNGPWDQLVRLKNIQIQNMDSDSVIHLNETIRIRPFSVPHRDEYTETIGLKIMGPESSCLFIPDIDKWEKLGTSIEKMLSETDIAFLDGSFYSNAEVSGRNMSEIPHPFIIESMNRFKALSTEERKKIHFIHFNHSNPALQEGSPVQRFIRSSGYGIAEEGQQISL